MDETKTLVTQIFAQESTGTVRSIDDILDSVTIGPLAAREAVDQLSDDVNLKEDGPSNDNVIPFRRWATSPLVYGGLAAAMALFILLPTRYNPPPLSSESSPVLADRLPRPDIEPTLSPNDGDVSMAKNALKDLEDWLNEPAQAQSSGPLSSMNPSWKNRKKGIFICVPRCCSGWSVGCLLHLSRSRSPEFGRNHLLPLHLPLDGGGQ